MSIDIEQLVLVDLDPVLELDPTITTAINSRIEAEMALRTWTLLDMTDQRSVYIALLVTRSFVARLLLKFAQEVKKAAAGKSSVEFGDAIKYLEALKVELDNRIYKAEATVNPSIIPSDEKWPGCGIVGF